MDELKSRNAGVPFSFFVSLLSEISNIKPRKAQGSHNSPKSLSPALQTLHRWITELQKRYDPLPDRTGAIFFRLIFPEEDKKRRYGMKESKLALELLKCFGLSDVMGKELIDWKENHGCLGIELRNVLDRCYSNDEKYSNSLTLDEVDNLLDELASKSAFSDKSLRKMGPGDPSRSRQSILRSLFRSLSSLEACFLAQIILKDLRPVLYPTSESNYTVALKNYNCDSACMLTKFEVISAWDSTGGLRKSCRVIANLDDAVLANDPSSSRTSLVGAPIEIPKSVKGQGCAHVIQLFKSSEKVWAETKYDGERAQIHVQIQPDGRAFISIFSKSKRDSSLDRIAVHDIVRQTLRLPVKGDGSSETNSKIKSNIVLEAEMVAFSDELNCIDEFWRIRSLIESTAIGVRRMDRKLQSEHVEDMTQLSLISNASAGGSRHLAMVFFDILVLNSASLLQNPYRDRRAILESVITPIPGRAMVASRTSISMTDKTLAEEQLRKAFAFAIADHQEGLMIKADTGKYAEHLSPWVKLKKDYIPGYGDTLDLCIFGASWDKERGRELRVPPSAYTTFYVGARNEVHKGLDKVKEDRPCFFIYFTVSYGLNRDQLEELNFFIKNSNPVIYSSARPPTEGLAFTYSLFPGLATPSILLREPLVAELFGAGFTKAPKSKHYELRFPRIAKTFRKAERTWEETVTLQEIHEIARQAIGRDRTHKDVDDWCNDLWGVPASPSAKCPLKRKETEEMWNRRLKLADKKRKTEPLLLPRMKALVSTTNDSKMASSSSSKLSRKEVDGRAIGIILPDTVAEITDSNDATGPRSRSPVGRASSLSLRINETDLSTSLELPLEVTVRQLFSQLMPTSLVWFVKHQTPDVLSLYAPYKSQTPKDHRLHSFESLLVGCGWGAQNSNGVGWMDRGLVFVSEGGENNGICWVGRTKSELKRRKEELGKCVGIKPVYAVLLREYGDGDGKLSVIKLG